MKNEFRINDDGTVSIILRQRNNGTNLETVLSKEDFYKYAEPFEGAWFAMRQPKTNHLYTRGVFINKETGSVTQPMLHRLILQPQSNERIVHKDGNTLNCVRDNMIAVRFGVDASKIIAEQEAAKAAEQEAEKLRLEQLKKLEEVPAAEAPLKGVSLHKVKNKWEVSPFYEKKRYRLGYWPVDQLAAANTAVTIFREIGPEEYFKRYPKGGKK